MKYLLSIVLALAAVKLDAQTFSAAPNAPVPDDGNFYSFTIEVSGLPEAIDMNFGLERICMNYYHSWDSDVEMWIIAPDGTQIELSTGNGGDGDGYINTCFTENAFFQITQGGAPFTGNYNPEGDLFAVNNGQNPNGIWTLLFYDNYWFADSGWLYEWSLSFTDEVLNPEEDPFLFTYSNLPLMYIHTAGLGIPDEPGIPAMLQVIDNGEGALNYTDDLYTFDGIVDIELRGQSTLGFPKKSYGFETKDDFGNDLDTNLLGFPKEEDWVLYAPYSEKSLLQNALAMELGRAIGGYHSRTRFCEVFLNDIYEGIYVLMEKIKQENDRVDIAKLDPDENSGDDVTGGYIFRIDWGNDTGWYSQFPVVADPNAYVYFQFVYPRPEVVTPPQQEYLKAYVDSFEFAVNAPDYVYGGKRYDDYIDLPSFVDNFIVNELSKNVDAYRLSSYYHKDKNGKIKAGPLWDFNLSFGNADYCDGADNNDWNFQVCGTSGPAWWPRMWADTVFRDLLKCRWDVLRQNVLSEASLNARIDSLAAVLNATGAVDRNFLRWPVLGVYVWPNPWPYATTHEEAIQQLKTWIANRIAWMDANITGEPLCIPYVDNQSVNTEYFESGFTPNCWTTLDADEDGFSWQGEAPVGGYGSVYSAFSYSFEGDGFAYDPDNYLVLPALLPEEGQHLTWYAARQSGGAQERYQVLLSTTGNAVEDFTVVLWDENLTSTDFVYRAADLSPWWGQQIYLAFRHFDSAGNMMLRIDEIRFPTLLNPAQDCTVGLGEHHVRKFTCWPNPSRDILYINGPLGSSLITLLDATGRMVYSQPYAGGLFSISVDGFEPGVYMLCNNGYSERVVIE